MDRRTWGLCPTDSLSVCSSVSTQQSRVEEITIHEHEKQLLILPTYAILYHILTEGDVNGINLLTVGFIQIFCTLYQWRIISRSHNTVATKLFRAEPNIHESSTENLFYVTLMITTIST
jgi:hypothetical protein